MAWNILVFAVLAVLFAVSIIGSRKRSDEGSGIPANSSSASGTEAADTVAQDDGETPRSDTEPPEGEGRGTYIHPAFDYPAFIRRLGYAETPIDEIKDLVGEIRTREADAMYGHSWVHEPYPIERFFAQVLEEAGLFKNDVELPRIRVLRPTRTKLVYLRAGGHRIPYLAKLRVIQLEAALNRVLLVWMSSDDPLGLRMQDCYRISQSILNSITAQLGTLTSIDGEPLPRPATGEWGVRMQISTGIETFVLPFRLTARFRLNLAEGRAAFQVDLTPSDIFPVSFYSPDFRRIMPASLSMCRRAASDYAMRLGILISAWAFRCSERIDEVWIAGVVDTATSHSCLYSVRLERDAVMSLDFQNLGDASALFTEAEGNVTLDDGILMPVAQSFALDDELFCPQKRYDRVELSTRELDPATADALGCKRVSDLGIDEDAHREIVAQDIVRNLSGSTEHNVRAILDLANADPDPSVRSAADRTIPQLIDGTISEDDIIGFQEEFVEGDPLSRAIKRAWGHVMRKDWDGAARIIEPELSFIDGIGLYEDTETTVWRSFSSYVQRVLFNRLIWDGKRDVKLVPEAYINAHHLLSAAYDELGRKEEAMMHAERLLELCPFSLRGHLQVARFLEKEGDLDCAIRQMTSLLECAYDAEHAGIAYYRLAFLNWQKQDLECAEACYRKCLGFASSAHPLAAFELMSMLATEEKQWSTMTEERIEAVLRMHSIPSAPTKEVKEALQRSAEASMDAELFEVARNFARALGSFDSDDVLYGVIRSIEQEPDR